MSEVERQAKIANEIIAILNTGPVVEVVASLRKLMWVAMGSIENNSIPVDLGEYIGTLEDVITGKHEDDGWLDHFKTTLIKDLDGLSDPEELKRFRETDHLELIIGKKTKKA